MEAHFENIFYSRKLSGAILRCSWFFTPRRFFLPEVLFVQAELTFSEREKF